MGKIINTQAKKLYKDYSTEVQNYMWAVHSYLQKKFNGINDEWVMSLMMLADNLEMFIQCRKQIKDTGLMITNRFNVLEKNPLIKVQNDAQIQIVKLLNEFALTPKSAEKIKEVEEEDNSPLTQFLNENNKEVR
ncbi:P27 family phage terminase small subunit [Phocaeicola barnesiae]|uniref:P27 family phage terminase small subunit n=1 Tax=Phocaeicola barnesiae TaxID=376804 RepID=A0AAW5N1Y5_9BACT|nr:P27 family phage terminase small subunit [Phocaeicola barnesiae]MCR8874881.1 P27 family phage terminase small subunit [Phocaeicola barnesiae]